MAKKVSPNKHDLVVQANSLVHARYTLPAAEKKLVALAYSKILKEDDVFQDYVFSFKDVAAYMGMDYRGKEDNLRRLCRNIMTRPVEIQQENGSWDMFNWISWIKYDRHAETVTFTLPPKIGPYLLQLRQEFTNVPLEYYVLLTGKYSLRLVEMLMQWRSTMNRDGFFSVPTITADQLRKEFMLEKKYSANKSLKQFVIDRAVAEINGADMGFIVKVESALRGGAIYGFDFSCRFYSRQRGEPKPVIPPTPEEEADALYIEAHKERYAAILAEVEADGTLFPNGGFINADLMKRGQQAEALARLRAEKPKRRKLK